MLSEALKSADFGVFFLELFIILRKSFYRVVLLSKFNG